MPLSAQASLRNLFGGHLVGSNMAVEFLGACLRLILPPATWGEHLHRLAFLPLIRGRCVAGLCCNGGATTRLDGLPKLA